MIMDFLLLPDSFDGWHACRYWLNPCEINERIGMNPKVLSDFIASVFGYKNDLLHSSRNVRESQQGCLVAVQCKTDYGVNWQLGTVWCSM